MTTPTRVEHEVVCRLVTHSDELDAHFSVRRAVFVTEQGVFPDSDLDARDTAPETLRVVGFVDGVPAGTVRLFPIDPLNPGGDWQGDRLAVLPGYRTYGLGVPLVRFAVATAGARGGERMIAHIQPANRTFFRRLGWTQQGEQETYVGLPHLLMTIPLTPGH
ncbi:MAG TPA: MSMEG_0567/Sll0786 family nitrogen starvation N-acetyltransferase [Pseudonocardia sp.]|jgi:putative N-acetyltransferase (TIGR04045 family)|nr:MSMEG_0567/Sll0786 family nitrogen starvation N-acetyltransferase [Pseudonocardia sp.]